MVDIYSGKMNANSNFLQKQSRRFLVTSAPFQSTAMFVVSEGIGYVPVPGVGEGFSAVVELLGDPICPREPELFSF